MSPELLTAYKLVVELHGNATIGSEFKSALQKQICDFLYIVEKETELEKRNVERWAAQAAGIITK